MNPDLGDSAIVETYGLGALAVAASPLVGAVGRASTRPTIERIDAELRAIAAGESPRHRVPGRARRRSSASTRARSPRRGSRRRSTPGSRTGSRASARSAAASRTRRWTPSTSRSRRSVDARRGGPPRAARRLLAGAFPYGQRLVEEQLAERFATSRTPVREALRRLEGDGHVVRDRSGGVRPNPPRVSAMRELYAVRIVLEDLAVRTADPERLDGLYAEWLELRAEHDDVARLRLRRRGASTRASRARRATARPSATCATSTSASA